MAICPRCKKDYPPEVVVCPDDGAALPGTERLAIAKTDVSDELAMAQTSASGEQALAVARTDISGAGASSGASAPRPATALALAPAAAAAASADQSMDPMVGARVAGRYEVIRRVGEGGMGAVYEARHTVIGKRVALKVLLEKFEAKSDFVARLLQEARLASSIGHVNIVDVTDFGMTEDGRSFVVMEFLDGESLAQLLARDAPLPIERCLRVCRQVASALSAAHAKGIVHRDIKPENVYLVNRGEADFVKVVDFGISKAVQPGENDSESHRLTHTGTLLGTPLYMSPEQARGQETDHRADIWALGVLMYECLTGEVPFRANNYLGVIAQVLNHKPPAPSELRPELGIPPAVEGVLARAMNKELDARYQQMSELERDLERLLAGDQNVGLTAPAPRVAAAGHGRWGLAAAATLLVAGGIGFALLRGGPGPRPVAPPPPPPPAPAVSTSFAPPPPVPVTAAAAVAPAPEPKRGPRRRGPKPATVVSTPATEAKPATPNPHLGRGVLPVGSPEAYSKP